MAPSRLPMMRGSSADVPEGETPVRERSPDIKYRALSYIWGQEAASRSVYIDGVPFAVCTNLWHFLERVRQSEDLHKDLWWIDALSIDQSSTLEKKYQIQNMGLIYCHASSVVSWLGTGHEHLDQMFEATRTSDTRLDDDSIEDFNADSLETSSVQKTEAEVCFPEEVSGISGYSVKEWDSSYRYLMALEYWCRE